MIVLGLVDSKLAVSERANNPHWFKVSATHVRMGTKHRQSHESRGDEWPTSGGWGLSMALLTVGAASVENDGKILGWSANGDVAKVLGVSVIDELQGGIVV